MKSVELEILEFNYWENFKFAKDIALIYPPEHPKRQELDKTLKEMVDKINDLKKN